MPKKLQRPEAEGIEYGPSGIEVKGSLHCSMSKIEQGYVWFQVAFWEEPIMRVAFKNRKYCIPGVPKTTETNATKLIFVRV